MTYFPGLSGPLPDELVRVRHGNDEYFLDVLALTSNYQCIYGRGCQGTSPLAGEGPGQHRPTDPSVTGCCRVGPTFGLRTTEIGDQDPLEADSPLRLMPFVAALAPGEAQHYDQIAAGDWYAESGDGGPAQSRAALVEGNCVFLNTEMANGKTGCSLFHLAARLGVDPKQTRPKVCHSAPAAAFTMADDLETAGGGFRLLVTLQPPWLGWFSPDGYFCTSDPAAYSAADPVFRRMASEYSSLLGEDVYATLAAALEEIWAERGLRLRRTWGTPVPLEMPKWAS
jgi:hypothetical protein